MDVKTLIVFIGLTGVISIVRNRSRRREYHVKGIRTDRVRNSTAADDILYKNYVPISLVFKGKIDESALKIGISRTLETFIYAGGRFTRTVTPEGSRWDVKATGEGITLEVLQIQSPYSFEQVSTLNTSNHDALEWITKKCYLPNNFPEINTQIPLVVMQLAVFNQGEFSILSIAPSHCLFDAVSMNTLLRTISHHTGLAGGKRNSTLLPKHLPYVSFKQPLLDAELANKVRAMDLKQHPALREIKTIPDSLAIETGLFEKVFKDMCETHQVFQCALSKKTIDAARLECETKTGRKVTTHEILSALILRGSMIDENERVMTLTVTNLRKRSMLFPDESFVGNAAESTVVTFDLNKKEGWIDLCVRFAQLLRTHVKTSCDEIFLWNEAYSSQFGPIRRQDIPIPRTPLGVLLHPKAFTINSWRGYPWYDLDFGTGNQPCRVGIPALTDFFFPRYCHFEDCTLEGDVRVLVTLTKQEIDAFQAYLKQAKIEFTRFG